MRQRRAAAGEVNETTIAATGVNLISVGAQTHSSQVMDSGLDAAGWKSSSDDFSPGLLTRELTGIEIAA